MANQGGLFSPNLKERFTASVAAAAAVRETTAADVMRAAKLPSEGVSGAANAYVVFVSDQFGAATPPWTPDEIDETGWHDLWRLRVGERNPHFLPARALFMTRRSLWSNLHDCLPAIFHDRELGYTMCAWANLIAGSQTGGSKRVAMEVGMNQRVAPLIRASHARVALATKKDAWVALERWAKNTGGTMLSIGGIQAYRVTIDSHAVLTAYVGGHPSHFNQFMTRAQFVQRVSAFLAASEKLPG